MLIELTNDISTREFSLKITEVSWHRRTWNENLIPKFTGKLFPLTVIVVLFLSQLTYLKHFPVREQMVLYASNLNSTNKPF